MTLSQERSTDADGGLDEFAPPEARQALAGKEPWAALSVLVVVGVINYIDRVLPYLLAEPMKADLNLSDTQLGLINGFGFLLVYAFVGIPIARIADRGAYGIVVSASLGFWSLMTSLGGLAQAGWQLAASRIGVAIGEAGSAPAAHGFVSSRFAPGRRARALAYFSMSYPIGATVGLVSGGFLAEALGWRGAFLVIGGLGLLMVPVVLATVRGSPPPAGGRPAVGADLQAGLGLLHKRAFLALVVASGVLAIATYSFTSFAPAFLMRSHGMSVGEVGWTLGLAKGALGLLGLFASGALADKLAQRDPRWLIWITVLISLVAAPCSAFALLTESALLATVFSAFVSACGMAYLAPAIAALHRLCAPNYRATASAVLLLATGLLGGLGPLFVGILSDATQAKLGADALAAALWLAPGCQILAAATYALAAPSYRREMVE